MMIWLLLWVLLLWFMIGLLLLLRLLLRWLLWLSVFVEVALWLGQPDQLPPPLAPDGLRRPAPPPTHRSREYKEKIVSVRWCVVRE